MGHYILAGDGSLIVERRATPRYDLTLSVEVAVSAEGAVLQGTTTNLSEAGVQILLPAALSESAIVEVSFPSFAGTAEVIWSRREGSRARLGMRFVSLSSEARLAIRDLLADARASTPAVA